MKHVFPSAVLFLALSVSANAQSEVVLRGEIENVPGSPGQFVLDFTDVALTSTTLPLQSFLEQKVEITGQWNGSSQFPAVEVTSVSPAPEVFEIGVRPRIGRDSYLGFVGTPGDLVVGVVSGGDAFIPLADGQVCLVDPGLVVMTMFGAVPGSGEAELGFEVPNRPELVGIELFAQGAVISQSGVLVTNPYATSIAL